MSNENKNIDDLFRERLGDYTETPPASSWSTLQGSLGQAKPPFVQITGGLLNYTIATLLVVSVAVLGVKYYMSHSRNEVVSAKSNQATNEMPVAQGTSAVLGAGGEKQAPNATTEKSEGQSGIVTSDASAPVEDRSTSVSGSGASVRARGNNSDQTAQNGKTKQINAIASNSGHKTNTSGKHSGGNNPRVYQSSTGQPAKSAGTISAPSVENKISENNLPAPANSLSSFATKISEFAPGLSPDDKDSQHDYKPAKKTITETTTEAAPEENPIADKKSLPTPDKWELWAKGGYEQNKNGQVYSSIIAPYLQRNFGKRFSLAIQPGLKTSNVTQKYLQGSQSFYHVNSDGAITEYDSSYGLPVGGGGLDSSSMFIIRNYRYTQTHDSIVKTYTAGGTMISLDLPITAKFKISKHLALTAGMVIHAGSYLGINERTTTYNNIMQTGYDSTFGITGRAIPSPKPLNEIITYNGNQLSTYKGPLFTTPAGIVMTYGYTLGLSYEVKDRFMLDATAQKSTVSSQIAGSYNINSYLSDWYFRLMLGYRIL